ncbi:peroxidase 24-like [Typha angustifolia]|uniref:peroxidase 24-like n=1 Tax=Typha angustifolia TaxID=59011 RepID=UPI003C2D4C29
MRSSFLLPLLLFSAISLCNFSKGQAGLQMHFYKKSCPNAEQIVQNIVWKHVAGNPELAAKFLRMFFHDCFVRGCDASILLDSTANNTAEKGAVPNGSLAGFEVIDEIKTAVEEACPEIVSCADMIALAARDSVSFQFKKPLWEVQTGRRDGSISRASEANVDIPSPFSNFTTLAKQFASKSLSVKDLVVLSGAHTIGIGHCNLFSNRLYNFTGKGDQDPSLNPTYAAFLKTKCTSLSDTTTTVPMDPGSSTSFDNHYYVNLRENKGLFTSDAQLLTNGRSANVVDKLVGSGGNFFNAFKNSIKRMGHADVLTGGAGEVRKNCRVVNS